MGELSGNGCPEMFLPQGHKVVYLSIIRCFGLLSQPAVLDSSFTVLLGACPPDSFFIEELCRRASYKAPALHHYWAHLHLPAFGLWFSCEVGIMQLLTLTDHILPGDCQLDDTGVLTRLGQEDEAWSQGGHRVVAGCSLRSLRGRRAAVFGSLALTNP